MLKAGITGGIGSGKTIVCQVFTTLGIPVFYADEAARYLMEYDTALVHEIAALLGEDVYIKGKLDRAKVSAIIFEQPGKLAQINALVHPATINYSRRWMQQQTATYVIKEAAIFFESGSYSEMDVMIGVRAPLHLRVKRAMDRSNLSREQVIAIESKQMDEDEKMKRCEYVITNDDVSAVLPQVLAIHKQLLSRSS
jgi:dephospho-CoA kinase